MAKRDPRVYFLVFLIFITCVISTPAAALSALLLYALLLLVILRFSAVPGGYVWRKVLAALPVICLLGFLMFLTRRGMLDRLLAFWNIFAKAYLLTLGTIVYINLAGSVEPAEKQGFNKQDLRALFGMLIVLAEIRLLGG